MLNIQEFGNRVQLIRENVLLMTQDQLAGKLVLTQVLLSRLERGIGGSINTVFDIINYLYSRDIAAMYIFSDHFSLYMVSERSNDSIAVGSQIEELIKEMQKTLRQRSWSLNCSKQVDGVRGSLITEKFSAKQGVEDDNMNVICLGGRVISDSLA